KENRIAIVTINRPSKLNALNKVTINELHEALKGLADDNEIRVIILTGSGEKAFVAGADISEFANFDSSQGAEIAAIRQVLLVKFIQYYPKHVIAAVNRFALGRGVELGMSAQFRVASDNAKMGLPEVTLGVIPSYGSTQRLTQMIG